MPLDLNGNIITSDSVSSGYFKNSIITNGLVLQLDAENKNSYNGSGVTWADLRGNYNGTMYNSPTFNSTSPSSIQLNGSNQYVELGSFFTYNNFAICLWVNPGSTQTQYADIIDNNHTGTQNFVLQQNSTTTNQYAFDVNGTSNSSSSGLFTLTANTWVFLSFVFNGSVLYSYRNGNLFAVGNSCTPNWSSQYLRLGQWGGGGRNWNGKYGNVMIYNRTLHKAEISNNYYATKARFGL
jgi:hypothetical protein